MAIRYATKNGNWSDVTVWDGGVSLPASGDTVYADGKTVTIDQDITVVSINTTQRSGGTAGGGFTITDAYTVNANIIAGTTHCLTTNNTIGTIITINGNIIAGTTNIASGIIHLKNGELIITGSVTGGSLLSGYQLAGVWNDTSGVITIYGLLIGGNYTYAVHNRASGIVNIVGDQTNTGTAITVHNPADGIINITGDITSSTVASPKSNQFLQNAGTGTVNITGDIITLDDAISATVGLLNNASTGKISIIGNVTGGSIANAMAISNSSTGTIEVTGNVIGGSHVTNTPAIYSATAGIIDVTGVIIANTYPAIYSPNLTASNILRGDIISYNNLFPIYGNFKTSVSSAQIMKIQDVSGVDVFFATNNSDAGLPLQGDVRYGTVYGSLNQYTGTSIIPSASTVSIGVPVDHTVGELALTPFDFWNYAQSGITSGIGARMKECATVSTVGDQLSNLM